MKKAIIVMVIALVLSTVLATSAMAAHRICSVNNCVQTYNHKHGGTTYAPHHRNDGHAYHTRCNTAYCSIWWNHSHASNYGHHQGGYSQPNYGHGSNNGGHHGGHH